MNSLELIVTSDGSHSLLNPQLNETYHSVHGALQESRYVFIEHGLKFWLSRNHYTPAIFEVGFGTGLNALLTLEYAVQSGQPVDYTTLEAFPLPEEVWSRLNYGDRVHFPEQFERMHRCSWNNLCSITPEFSFKKIKGLLQDLVMQDASFDVIYFDAFAPAKQPEMWSFEMLERTTAMMKPSGVFVTYCAKGQVKRDLKALGLVVETLPGPPGKKEMVRGLKP